MTRKIVVEVNPSVDYLSSVLREMRWRFQEENCKDPFLQRAFEKRAQASPYRYVRGKGGNVCSFRFDLFGRRHHKGAFYIFFFHGLLQKIDRGAYGKQDEWGDRNFESIAEIETPALENLTPEVLLNLLQELEVSQIMSS
jgi:hypothetical protein